MIIWSISKIKVKLLLSMVQIITLLGGTLQLEWPKGYEDTTDSVGAVVTASPLQLFTIRCLAPTTWNWHAYFLTMTIVPTALLLACALVASLLRLGRSTHKAAVADNQLKPGGVCAHPLGLRLPDTQAAVNALGFVSYDGTTHGIAHDTASSVMLR